MQITTFKSQSQAKMLKPLVATNMYSNSRLGPKHFYSSFDQLQGINQQSPSKKPVSQLARLQIQAQQSDSSLGFHSNFASRVSSPTMKRQNSQQDVHYRDVLKSIIVQKESNVSLPTFSSKVDENAFVLQQMDPVQRALVQKKQLKRTKTISQELVKARNEKIPVGQIWIERKEVEF
ncbi:Hypothetical_protein [Hexamita inflata]|uniref:Hypothetical_protein n=1 Tax=Hexamita inflata TaxID=28002 RepID=A0AA86R3R0_9EUKA|nr:Hypothetical protein HINF_LOCUS54146 [Hexamita inflata]